MFSLQSKIQKESKDQIFRCSITGLIMVDPVSIDGIGSTYEREAIVEAMKLRDIDPLTNKKLPKSVKLTKNSALKGAIDNYLQDKDITFFRDEVYLPQGYLDEVVYAVENNDLSSLNIALSRDPRLLYEPLSTNNSLTVFHYTCLSNANINQFKHAFQQSNYKNTKKIKRASSSMKTWAVMEDTTDDILKDLMDKRFDMIEFLLKMIKENNLVKFIIDLASKNLQENIGSLEYLNEFFLKKLKNVFQSDLTSKQFDDNYFLLLMSLGANIILARDIEQKTVLHLYAERPDLKEKSGHHLDRKSEEAEIRIIEKLINRQLIIKDCHDFFNIKDIYEKTALHYAVESNKFGFVRYLLICKANPNIADGMGRYPLDLIMEKLYSNNTDSNLYSFADLLIAHGADINHINRDNESYLDMAIKHGNLTLVQYLIFKNISLDNSHHPLYKSYLQAAVYAEKTKIVEYFLKEKIVVTRNGELHIAVRNGNELLISLLLIHGYASHINEYDDNKQTPLAIAYHDKKFDIAMLLMHKGADYSEIEEKASKADPIKNPDQHEIYKIICERKKRLPRTLYNLQNFIAYQDMKLENLAKENEMLKSHLLTLCEAIKLIAKQGNDETISSITSLLDGIHKSDNNSYQIATPKESPVPLIKSVDHKDTAINNEVACDNTKEESKAFEKKNKSLTSRKPFKIAFFRPESKPDDSKPNSSKPGKDFRP